MIDLTHFSLFTGIGGLDLAAEQAGFRTVGQCEAAEYPYRILERHWPQVPKWRDVRSVTGDDVAKKSGQEITVLSGGFPCQPHSLAGKRLASGDKRDMWGEFARVICEVKPRWVVAENVPGLLSSEHGRFFGRILRDLAAMGYDAGWGVFSAFHAGMEHERQRICVVAHASGQRRNVLANHRWREWNRHDSENTETTQPPHAHELYHQAMRILSDPDSRILRDVNGISDGMDRITALGNAAVPRQFYPVFRAIAEIEMEVVENG